MSVVATNGLGHVEVRNATKVFPGRAGRQDVHALGPISLSLKQGEFFSVVGPSGCGKSTLLDLVAGRSTTNIIRKAQESAK